MSSGGAGRLEGILKVECAMISFVNRLISLGFFFCEGFCAEVKSFFVYRM